MTAEVAAWIAVGAVAVALGALVLAFLAWRSLRRVRSAQGVVLGGGSADVVDFAVSLQARIDDLHKAVDEVAAGLARVDRRVDGSLARTSIVRYDAYQGTGGQQSASVAVLDSSRTGVVLSAIQGRDYARIYVKELDRGRAPVALSPEEQEAGARAMAGGKWGGSGPAGCYRSARLKQVLVLNASYEPLNVTSVRRAHVLVFKGKAEVIEELDRPLHAASDTFPWPHVIRLVAYVRVPRAVQRKISRRALFARDGWRCVYCGTSGGRLTLDHVVPRSRGGESSWENVVTSCASCNHKKGDRLLEETQMTMSVRPRPPAPVLFIQIAAPRIPVGWEPYLSGYGTTTRDHSAAA